MISIILGMVVVSMGCFLISIGAIESHRPAISVKGIPYKALCKTTWDDEKDTVVVRDLKGMKLAEFKRVYE